MRRPASGGCGAHATFSDVDLRKRAAIALGFLGDAGAVEVLKKVIEESGASKAVLGAATVAMGFIGDLAALSRS